MTALVILFDEFFRKYFLYFSLYQKRNKLQSKRNRAFIVFPVDRTQIIHNPPASFSVTISEIMKLYIYVINYD